MVQWLGLCSSTAEGPGLFPDWGAKIPEASQCSQKKKKRPNKNMYLFHRVGVSLSELGLITHLEQCLVNSKQSINVSFY